MFDAELGKNWVPWQKSSAVAFHICIMVYAFLVGQIWFAYYDSFSLGASIFLWTMVAEVGLVALALNSYEHLFQIESNKQGGSFY